MHTHTHAHHICKNTQEVLVVIAIWLLSYAPTSEAIIEWGEHSGNSNGKWSSFSLQTLSSEILWRLPPAPSWYRDVSTHIAFIGFDWQVCLVSCTQFQVSVRLDLPHLGAPLLLKSLLALAQATWSCYGLKQGLDRCRWWGASFLSCLRIWILESQERGMDEGKMDALRVALQLAIITLFGTDVFWMNKHGRVQVFRNPKWIIVQLTYYDKNPLLRWLVLSTNNTALPKGSGCGLSWSLRKSSCLLG